jgi:hypothetical protein
MHLPASCKRRFSHENPRVELRCSSGHLNWQIHNCAPIRAVGDAPWRTTAARRPHRRPSSAVVSLGRAHDLEAGGSSMPAQTFAQEDVAGRETTQWTVATPTIKG